MIFDFLGNTTVNGLEVMEANELKDGTIIYVLDGILFNYSDDVRSAFEELLQQPSQFGPLGTPLGKCNGGLRT